MPTDKTEAVLKWLDAILTQAQDNPLVLLQAKKDIEQKKDIVEEAIRDALLPEFQPYADTIAKLLQNG